MDCSRPGFLVHHYFPELTQIQVRWVSDIIQPSHPLLPLSPLALSLSQNQSFPMNQLFTSGGQNIETSASASVLPLSIQGWFPLRLTGLISLLSKGLSRVFSNTTVWKHQFFGIQTSLWSISHTRIWLLEETIALTVLIFVGKVTSLLFNTQSRLIDIPQLGITKPVKEFLSSAPYQQRHSRLQSLQAWV